MARKCRTFSKEFKLEAACLVLDKGYSHQDACQPLGIGETALRRWAQQLERERNCETPNSKALTPEQKKIQELEARTNHFEREKTILKKATALLISEEMNNITEAADYAPYVGFTLPWVDRFQVPHHGSRLNVSTELLERLRGEKPLIQPSPDDATFTAIVSASKKDEYPPRKAIIRGMIHRKGKVNSANQKTA